MMADFLLYFLCPFYLLPFLLFPAGGSPASSDSRALLTLKSSFSNNVTSLSTWTNTSSPCDPKHPWAGVVCLGGIVTGLRLGNLNLSGTIDANALSRLRGLRTVSFVNNLFSGEIPDFRKLRTLKAVYLSNNHFQGDIPDEYFSGMTHLKKIWLSGNSFTSDIPSSIAKLTVLMELHLEDNEFTGRIPNAELPELKSFNVSNNVLEGEIPARFAVFSSSSFEGNVGLCGKPIASCEIVVKENKSGNKPVVAAVMFSVTLALVAVMMAVKRKKDAQFDTLGIPKRDISDKPQVSKIRSSNKRQRDGSSGYMSTKKGSSESSRVAKFVIVNEEKGTFGLPDLMNAAAEVLGNGSLGTAFKAVMPNGMSVVVKRMREMNRLASDDFDTQMRRLGGVRHPNVLTPIAYHYRNEEKLVVFEYINKGSLMFILHGDCGPYHAALDWPTRLKIIQGISHGLAHLHQQFPNSEVPHGNLKSGNVLLGHDFTPLIVDYGYIPFIQPSHASTSLFSYKSPEFIHYRHVSPKSDVYCLGVIILEVLTGRFPFQYVNKGKGGGTDVVQWVAAAVGEGKMEELLDPEIVVGRTEEEVKKMERMVRFGLELVESNPDKRPDSAEVVRRVEDIGDISSSLSPEIGDIASSLSPETTIIC